MSRLLSVLGRLVRPVRPAPAPALALSARLDALDARLTALGFPAALAAPAQSPSHHA